MLDFALSRLFIIIGMCILSGICLLLIGVAIITRKLIEALDENSNAYYDTDSNPDKD